VPTRVKLAVGEMIDANGAVWRAGGALIQRVAGDAARGFTDEDWSRAEILFATLTDAELIDPGLTPERVLYRLFHEDAVRAAAPAALVDRCTCDAQRLSAILKSLPQEDLEPEADGMLHARCEFCSREYVVDPAALV
jgi:molecular chaperone Hsp33